MLSFKRILFWQFNNNVIISILFYNRSHILSLNFILTIYQQCYDFNYFFSIIEVIWLHCVSFPGFIKPTIWYILMPYVCTAAMVIKSIYRLCHMEDIDYLSTSFDVFQDFRFTLSESIKPILIKVAIFWPNGVGLTLHKRQLNHEIAFSSKHKQENRVGRERRSRFLKVHIPL